MITFLFTHQLQKMMNFAFLLQDHQMNALEHLRFDLSPESENELLILFFNFFI